MRIPAAARDPNAPGGRTSSSRLSPAWAIPVAGAPRVRRALVAGAGEEGLDLLLDGTLQGQAGTETATRGQPLAVVDALTQEVGDLLFQHDAGRYPCSMA